jgi:hypothetical protein
LDEVAEYLEDAPLLIHDRGPEFMAKSVQDHLVTGWRKMNSAWEMQAFEGFSTLRITGVVITTSPQGGEIYKIFVAKVNNNELGIKSVMAGKFIPLNLDQQCSFLCNVQKKHSNTPISHTMYCQVHRGRAAGCPMTMVRRHRHKVAEG